MRICNGAHDRRAFLRLSSALAIAGLSATRAGSLRAAAFPERPMQIYIPTRAGGGADRNFRTFAGVWKKHLKADFEPAFFPGAAGRVGYETYMGKAADDCHELIFGNMGPEVLNWVVQPPDFPLEDYFYFLMVDADPGSIFVRTESDLKTVDDVIAAGRKRTLTVATSRLAHPASLGMLVLARKTGMQVNLIPLSGGKNTRNGVLTGEVDLGVLPASSAMGRSGLAVIGLFDDKNVVPDRLPDAVLLNTHYALGIPPLPAGARAFGIKTVATTKHPDRYARLVETGMKVFEDPDYKEAVLAAKAPWSMITPGGADACKAYVDNVMALGREYRDLLTG